MKLVISHMTEYAYPSPVTDSVNEIRLSPFTNEHQSCYQHAITVEPAASLFSYEDYYGNRVHAFSVNAPHRRLAIKTQMTVMTKLAARSKDLYSLMPAEAAWSSLQHEQIQNRYAEFLLPTAYTMPLPEVQAYLHTIPVAPDEGGSAANGLGTVGVYEWLSRLNGKIRADFVYDPAATDVQSTVAEIMQRRRGVCQDFAHLMLAVCRSKGVPARYVSGYHFVGDLQGGNAAFEQASHAWVEAYVPGEGWCGFDPTNDEPIGQRHVKLAHGRDYRDIVPVKGVYRGTGVQELKVTVDVRNAEERID